MATQTTQQPDNDLARRRSADEFEVFDISDPTRPSSNGTFMSLDEARGCVEFDGLTFYEIWQGDHIVAGRDQEGVRPTSGFAERDPGDLSIDEMYGRLPNDVACRFCGRVHDGECAAPLNDDDDTMPDEATVIREQQIVAEHALAESRALLGAPRRGFFATVQALRESSKCPECGKTRFVFNAAVRGFKPEKVTVDAHCTCAGGPAHHLLSGAGSGAEV